MAKFKIPSQTVICLFTVLFILSGIVSPFLPAQAQHDRQRPQHGGNGRCSFRIARHTKGTEFDQTETTPTGLAGVPEFFDIQFAAVGVTRCVDQKGTQAAPDVFRLGLMSGGQMLQRHLQFTEGFEHILVGTR